MACKRSQFQFLASLQLVLRWEEQQERLSRCRDHKGKVDGRTRNSWATNVVKDWHRGPKDAMLISCFGFKVRLLENY